MTSLAPISPIAEVKRLALMFAAGLIILASSVDKSTGADTIRRPELPSRSAGIPFPPAAVGCYHLVGKKWQKISCGTQSRMKKLPPAMLVPSITAYSQSPLSTQAITPIVWGSVAVAITSDPTKATERDSAFGPNTFSIQNNTNPFPCTTCSANSPIQGANAGDLGAVQFVADVQSESSQFAALGSSTALCIEQQDFTYEQTLLASGGNVSLAFTNQWV
jgi:hypothetical protein